MSQKYFDKNILILTYLVSTYLKSYLVVLDLVAMPGCMYDNWPSFHLFLRVYLLLADIFYLKTNGVIEYVSFNH